MVIDSIKNILSTDLESITGNVEIGFGACYIWLILCLIVRYRYELSLGWICVVRRQIRSDVQNLKVEAGNPVVKITDVCDRNGMCPPPRDRAIAPRSLQLRRWAGALSFLAIIFTSSP